MRRAERGKVMFERFVALKNTSAEKMQADGPVRVEKAYLY